MSEATTALGQPDPFESDNANTTAEDTVVTTKSQPTKKVFTRADIKRSVPVMIHLPKVYPGYEPWEFEFRLKLSKEAEERRQEYLSLSASDMTVKISEQALDEICDLMVSLPKGFGDLKDTGQGPGPSFRSYVETSDPEVRDQLYTIVEGADNLYWQSISPREFHRAV
jgi:hypothetical protein